MIEFDDVSKSFKAGRPGGIKNMLLGTRNHRYRSTRVDAVKNVTFRIESGESVALLGANGAGKSTVLKLLAGTISPTSGTVKTQGRIAPLLELGAGFHPDLTGRENVFLNASVLGLSRSYTRSRFGEILDFSGLEDAIDVPVRFYSSGMYARLGFSVAVHADPDIVLIDEVLAVGDVTFQERCLQRMSSMKMEGRTMVLVTHDLDRASSFSTRHLLLDHGALSYDGPPRSRPADHLD